MIIGGTFATLDALEILVMLAIPALLIVLLVRSFRKPSAKSEPEENAGVA